MKKIPWLLVAAVAATALLRFACLGSQGLTNDEASDIWIGSIPLHDFRIVLLDDMHPPLYYTMLHFWEMLMGQGEVAVRALSALFGCVTCGLVWKWGREIDARTATIGACLYAFWGPAVDMDRFVKSYFLVTCLVTLSSVLLLNACRTNDVRWWPAYSVSALLLLYTHYSGPIILLAHLCSVPAAHRRRFLVASGAAVLLFLPWLPMWRAQGQHWRAYIYLAPFSWMNYALFLAALPGFSTFGGQGVLAVLLALSVPALLWMTWPRRDLASVLAWRTMLVYIAVLTANTLLSHIHTLQTRYISVILVPFLILLAGELARVQTHTTLRRMAVAVAAAILIGLNAIGSLDAVFDPGSALMKWDVTAARVVYEHQAGDTILLVPSFNLFPFLYHYPDGFAHLHWENQQLSILPYPDVTFYPIQPPFNPAMIDAACTTRGRVWLIATEGEPLLHTVTDAVLQHHRTLVGGFIEPGRMQSIVVGIFAPSR